MKKHAFAVILLTVCLIFTSCAAASPSLPRNTERVRPEQREYTAEENAYVDNVYNKLTATYPEYADHQKDDLKARLVEAREELAKQIQSQIDEYKLQQSDELLECIFWQDEDGGLYLCAEHIACVTDKTTKQFGCGDHAHLFGRVKVF